MTLTQQQVLRGLQKRKDHIIANLETLSMKTLRKDLAAHLSVEDADLKQHKQYISDWLDQNVINTRSAQNIENQSPGSNATDKKEKAKATVKKHKTEESADSDKPKKKHKAPDVKPAAAKTVDPVVQQLKNVCQQATIKIPPAVYKKCPTNEGLRSELEAMLAKHGLTRKSGPKEIAATRAKLAKARDLEGINMDNIIEVPSRRRAAAAPVDYSKLAAPASPSDADSELDSDREAGDNDDDDGAEESSELGSDAPEASGDGNAPGTPASNTPSGGQTAGRGRGEWNAAGQGEEEEDDDADADNAAGQEHRNADASRKAAKSRRRALMDSDDDSL